MGHFGNNHNTLCLSPQILHKHCFQFPLGLTVKDPDNHANRFNGKCLFPVNGDELKGFNTGSGFTAFYYVLQDCNVFGSNYRIQGHSFPYH